MGLAGVSLPARKRIQNDPNSRHCIDESLRTTEGANTLDEFIKVYADKMPKTQGAPVREAAAG